MNGDRVWKSCDEFEVYYLCDPALVEEDEDEEGRWYHAIEAAAMEAVVAAADNAYLNPHLGEVDNEQRLWNAIEALHAVRGDA